MGCSLISLLYELSIIVLLVTKVKSETIIIQDTQACCGTEATFRCIVTEASSLTWVVGSFTPVGYISISPLNTPDRRGDNDEFEFVLDNVQPNPNNPTLLSDFNSTLTVDVGLNDMLNGIQIQCDDLVTIDTVTLTLETTQEAINDDGMCDCPEGGGDVTATWSVPELCGWENVVPNVSLTCLTCTTPPPAPDPLSQLTSSQQISFPVRDLVADNNYTIEISATNACGDITRRSCVAVCSMASNLRDACKVGSLGCPAAGAIIGVSVFLVVFVIPIGGIFVFVTYHYKKSSAVGTEEKGGKGEAVNIVNEEKKEGEGNGDVNDEEKADDSHAL